MGLCFGSWCWGEERAEVDCVWEMEFGDWRRQIVTVFGNRVLQKV